MWPFGKKSARRKEIRRSKAESQPAWYQRLLDHIHVQATLTTLAAAAGVAVILNMGSHDLLPRTGQSSPRAIASRLDFRIEDTAQTQAMKLRERDSAPNYYRLDQSLLDDIRGRLTSALKLANEHAADTQKLLEEAAKIKIHLDEAGLAELLRIAALPEATTFEGSVSRALALLAESPLVEAAELAGLRTATDAKLIDAARARERTVRVQQLVFANSPEAAAEVVERATRVFSEPLRASMRGSIAAMLRRDDEAAPVRPIYRYDSESSVQAAQEAEERVPTQYTTYARGSLLADTGVITEDEARLLRSEHEQYRQLVSGPPPVPARTDLPETEREAHRRLLNIRTEARQADQLAMLGRGVLAFCVVFGLAGYIWRYHAKTVGTPVRQWIVAGILLLMLALGRVAAVSSATPHVAVGAQAFAAGLLAIVYPQGLVFAIAGALAVLMNSATQQSISFIVVLLTVSGTLVFALRDVRQRGKIVAVGAISGLVALGTTLAAGVIDHQPLLFVLWKQALWAGVATLAAMFVVEGILPGIERLFGLSTSMTLLEMCDASRPLLRRLAAEAPGTYNHSLLVGALAEAAATDIGANSLLVRAGAYYHDIGKIHKPEYFVENQAMGVSRHDRLSPAMSHLIIIGHVKDGLEMAKEYGLPAALHCFIPEHHGTTLVEYFYHAASQQRKPGDREVSDTEYRYTGPKPQSRETAILMLADGVEGAVRAMSEPTPGRIEDTVGKIVRKRLMDGQFDECDLTFREVEMVEASLVKRLCSIYHSRIVYPEEATKPAESQAS